MSREMIASGIGYIGNIPTGWHTVPGKSMFDEVKNKNTDGVVTTALKFTYGEIVQKENFEASTEEYVADTIKLYNIVAPADIVVNGLNLNYDFVSQRVAIVKEEGVITSAYVALRPRSHVNPRYLNYHLKACDNMKVFHGMGEGIRQTIKFVDLGNMSLLCPDTETQDAIVRYLDTKCSAIDEAIEKHKKIIERLEEYRYYKIASFTSSFPLVRIGRFLKSVQTGPFGSQLHSDEYIEDGIAVINPANIKNGEVAVDNKCTISLDKATELSRHILYPGDIIIGRRGEMGRCAVIKDNGMLCGTGCFVIKCGENIIPDYASLCIRSKQAVDFLTQNAIGTTMLNLNTDTIIGCPIPYCDIKQQIDVVKKVEKTTAGCLIAIQKHQNIIEKLEEYKKSIIYNAVTGKIDCREDAK